MFISYIIGLDLLCVIVFYQSDALKTYSNQTVQIFKCCTICAILSVAFNLLATLPSGSKGLTFKLALCKMAPLLKLDEGECLTRVNFSIICKKEMLAGSRYCTV